MTPEIVEEQLAQKVATMLNVDPSVVQPKLALHDLGIDSMSFVELLVFIEKDFGLKLIETGLTRDTFRTIRSLAKCIVDELKG